MLIPIAPHYDLVIFDCDGVLIDSERIAARVGAEVLTDLGWLVTTEEVIERFVGCSADHWRRIVESKLGRTLPDGWEEPYDAWYESAFEAELEPITGVGAVVRTLQELGTPYCVASNSSRRTIARNLARTGLAEYFEGRVFSAQDVPSGKPAPDVFLHAARQMGIAPSRCVVIEDSPVGLAAARAAGMDCLAFAGGLLEPERLRGPRTRLFRDMAEVLDLLCSRPTSTDSTKVALP